MKRLTKTRYYFDVNHMACKPKLILLALAVLLAPLVAKAEDPATVKPKRYEQSQTFKGKSFFKDINIWVYNATFAEYFGMPDAGIEPKLKNIEAAAFRIEPSSVMCGLAGAVENCRQTYRCMLDIYVDESKHPLPWAVEQQTDWAGDYTSLKSLTYLANEFAITPAGVIDSGWGGMLHPFVNANTHKEANFFHNGSGPRYDDDSYNHVYVYGYKRQAVNAINIDKRQSVKGLTMVTLMDYCSTRNSEKKQVNYRLEDRGSHGLSRDADASISFEFDLPEQFLNQRDAKIQLNDKPDIELYKKLLNKK